MCTSVSSAWNVLIIRHAFDADASLRWQSDLPCSPMLHASASEEAVADHESWRQLNDLTNKVPSLM